jgi:tRNA modification GTPase
MTFPAPGSYTGEDSFEVLIPGNPVLAERVVLEFTRLPGVRLATPGEFSARAYLHGRLTLGQAEGVAAMIAARSEDELADARRLMEGQTGKMYASWCDELATLLGLVEAGIDFTDQEDVVPIAPAQLSRRIGALVDAIGAHLGSDRGAEAAPVIPTVALAGPPNAGKSTLFNALLGRRRSVVSPVAGTTRDVLSERLELGDQQHAGAVMLQDLAGLDPRGSEGGASDREAQEAALAALKDADVLLLCDPAGRFETAVPGDAGRPTIRVRTKADMPGGPVSGAVPVCAIDGYNLGALRRAMWDAACAGRVGRALPPRHRRALEQTLYELRLVRGGVRSAHAGGLGQVELVAEGLRAALDVLGELTGEVTPDDVIGRIFATFCVGK